MPITVQHLCRLCQSRSIPFSETDDIEDLRVLIVERDRKFKQIVPEEVKLALRYLAQDQTQNTQTVRTYIEKLLFSPDS